MPNSAVMNRDIGKCFVKDQVGPICERNKREKESLVAHRRERKTRKFIK